MAFTNRIRLPFKITRPQFPEDRSVYRKANGETFVLSVVVKKTYEGETDWLPENWHERLAIALAHDNITIEGDKYLGGVAKDGDYEIDWQKFLDYPTAKATFQVQVTPFDNTNNNCQTCEQATQLDLSNDTFPDTLEEDQDYSINVANDDNICCYPAVFSITSYDSDYIESADIDQNGVITIHTTASFVSANGLKLLTYRVTCPNGSFDEADVFGNLEGSIPGCLAPSNPSISMITTSSAHILFTESPSTPDHYLWRLYKESAPGVIVQTDTVTDGEVELEGLAEGTAYKLYIRAQCDATNDDATASNFIEIDFSTNPASTTCGQYKLSFFDPSKPPGSTTPGSYMDCSGNIQPVFIPNNTEKKVCAMQTAPGVPVFINPGIGSYTHGTDSDCNSTTTYTKISVGKGTGVPHNACASIGPVYLSALYSDIQTGITVYDNASLTSPLTNYTYISDLSGHIYNIDADSGIVGSITGTTC